MTEPYLDFNAGCIPASIRASLCRTLSSWSRTQAWLAGACLCHRAGCAVDCGRRAESGYLWDDKCAR